MKDLIKKPHRSKVHRRSGNAVVEYCKLLEFNPDLIVMGGVGMRHHETEVMRENFEGFELYGFEPSPEICKSIKDKFPGYLTDKALSDQIGSEILYVSRSWKDGSSFYKKKNDGDQNKTRPVSVLTTTLDDFFSHHMMSFENEECLLWLDCEGSEALVIRGGKKFIKNHVKVINVEMTGKPRNKGGWASPYEVHLELVKLGFYQVWTHTHRSVIGQFDAIYVDEDHFDPRYCSCPDSYARWAHNKKVG